MIIRKEIDVKKPLTAAQCEILKNAENLPIALDEDCPELTAEDLKKMRRISDKSINKRLPQ